MREARELLAVARGLTMQAMEMREKMPNPALWCDSGHSFSSEDKGRKSITIDSSDAETGEQDSRTRQFCGGCTPTTELLAQPRTRPPGYEPVAPLNRLGSNIAPTYADREV